MATPTPHLTDPILASFLQPSFDPAAYLNSTLPPLSSTPKPSQNATSLANLSSETQSLLATLNAQATRLTNTLTQLTDDILRTGSRLAYQVDVLRGESTALNDTFSERLQPEIDLFVPPPSEDVDAEETLDQQEQEGAFKLLLTPNEPAHIARLRLLTHVRARLDSVIRVFGSAIAWPTPATSSHSFISVSAPPSSEADIKAKEYAEGLRAELAEAVVAGDEEGAYAKVEELRGLMGVWKGTAEERSRDKFISDLVKMVEDMVHDRDGTQAQDDQAYLTGIYT
ncbi:hypothetical protein BT63DRAFT_35296 [Microthyrium microscopicum]|uniref:Uncharacterized protein n=1 Tax=Microthyrium microscopicum TaxID=703497 RepID=A0A6A6USN4_9PEZI|nr:hypothetical protein BT63DRAFT_35296 [Microthyrium microscopicum]